MRKEPDGLQRDVMLAPYTTLKIGGPAKYFSLVTSVEHLREVLDWANDQHIPWRVLGTGSNTLVSDKGFDGLVMVMKNDSLEWTEQSVVADAGITNGQLIASVMQHGCGGLQWLVGVPGTVGGSLYGNAGGHGWGLGDQVEWVEYMDPTGNIRRWDKKECAFRYRYSAFKEQPGIILRAQMTFPKVDHATERQLIADVAKTKNQNQPTTAQSAGCMFTNPIVDPAAMPDDLRQFVADDGTISAWRLIVAVGLQGKKIGQIQISEKHANFMTNLGGATADQVVQLLSLVKQQVRDKLGIQLHEEVQYLGF